MYDRAQLEELLATAEAATGSDRELDFAIISATNPHAGRGGPYESWQAAQSAFGWDTRVTSSIDAVLALVERCLPGAYLDLAGPAKYLNIPSPIPNRWRAHVTTDEGFQSQQTAGWAASAPLAILAALLRALIAQQGKG